MQRIINLFYRLPIVLGFIAILLPQLAQAGIATLNNRPDVDKFIKKMSKEYGFDRIELANLFQQVHFRSDILHSFKRPKEASPWYVYRNFFITEKRVQLGAQFWQAHEKTLELAQKKYGVPPNVIVAIIGVETQYGQNTGKYRVIDTLSTMAFLKNSRQKFFKNELEQFLLLTRDQGINPLSVRGSYAGAIGIPQFMPSSYRRYAVSLNGDNTPNLTTDPDDAILSVANYFHKYGWQPGAVVTVPAKVKGNEYEKYVNKGLQPRYSVADLMSAGVQPQRPVPKTDKAILLQLKQPNDYEYWLGFNNFYVISGYNPSLMYTMAVYQLAGEIQKYKNKHSIAMNTPAPAAVSTTTTAAPAKPTKS